MGSQDQQSASSGLSYLKYAASGRNRFVSGIAALAALGGFLFGYDTGIVSQAQPYFKKALHTTTFEQSWIVASLLLGAVVGAAGAGYLSDRISRKWTKFVSGCVYVLGIAGALQDGAGLVLATLAHEPARAVKQRSLEEIERDIGGDELAQAATGGDGAAPRHRR